MVCNSDPSQVMIIGSIIKNENISTCPRAGSVSPEQVSAPSEFDHYDPWRNHLEGSIFLRDRLSIPGHHRHL